MIHRVPLSDPAGRARPMGMQILEGVSHLDHGLDIAQIDYLLDLFSDRIAFFKETVTLPERFGTVPCGLYGPLMGDPPMLFGVEREGDLVPYLLDRHLDRIVVTHGRRGDRTYDSRLVNLPPRQTRLVTVIAGGYEDIKNDQGYPCIVYTIFGGPLAPKETGDPSFSLTGPTDESREFWAEHALSR